jgi:hypothetical protein
MLKNISSSRLRVEIAEPGTPPNTTCRFDRSGFVTEVELDGEIRFCASEPNNLSHPSSGGRGLCNEYKLLDLGDSKAGALFPKPGIGLMLNPDGAPYAIFRKYELTPYNVKRRFEESKAFFITEPSECMGVSLRQEKSLEVAENVLTMSVALENTGDLPFSAMEYCHNFLSPGGMALSPDCWLEVPAFPDYGTRAIDGSMIGRGHGIGFSAWQREAMFHEIAIKDIAPANPFEWRLVHAGAKAAVSCSEDISLGLAYVWAADHSLESFHSISLLPGEKSSWKRAWRFEKI